MFKTKLLAGVLLIIAVLFAQVGTVFASTAAQETTPITGTIESLSTDIDESGETIVLVKLEGYQVISLSAQEADDFGLYDLDTQQFLVQVGDTVNLVVDPSVVIPEEPEEAVHPIAEILGSFFGVDPAIVDAYHDDGFGFGVIAQALWISQGLNGDATTAGLVLEAKRSGDYSAFVLPDGSTPTNWGQFKKAALGKDKKNLGIIVSGHAENVDTEEALTQQQNGNGHGNGYGRNNNPGRGRGNNRNP